MNASRLRRLLAPVAALIVAGIAAAQTAAPVRVGSKIDTEGSLLGSMIIAVLEGGGIRTENKVQLGTTKIVRGAIIAGEIDLYPEYTGNGAYFFADEKDPAWKSGKEKGATGRPVPLLTQFLVNRARRGK